MSCAFDKMRIFSLKRHPQIRFYVSAIGNKWSPAVINTYNAAGVSRRQHQNVTNFVKNVNILEFGSYIWNHYEKCIQKSPNMPGIGSLIREIDVKIEIYFFWLSKTNARILSVNTPWIRL